MSRSFLAAALTGALLLGAIGARADSHWVQITSEDQFTAAIVGRDLEDRRGNTLTLRRNGTYVASHDGRKARGDWRWSGTTLCRESRNDERAGCHTWEVAGDWVRVTPDSGDSNRAIRYRFK